jgi:uncharacterized protein YodC (DUF2158 family)
LYEYRDHYFEKFGVDRAVFKNDDVKKIMEKTLKVVESHRGKY